MRYGNQRVQTAVVTELRRLESRRDVLKLIDQFHTRYGERFGQGSQAPEAGVRINTIRVCSFVEQTAVTFDGVKLNGRTPTAIEPVEQRMVHFVGIDSPVQTPVFGEAALEPGTHITGPAIVTTRATTYLVEPGWSYSAARHGAVWFTRDDA